MNKPETIYLYRRKGQPAFASCDLERYAELYGDRLFETKIAYAGDDLDILRTANKRLREALIAASKADSKAELGLIVDAALRGNGGE